MKEVQLLYYRESAPFYILSQPTKETIVDYFCALHSRNRLCFSVCSSVFLLFSWLLHTVSERAETFPQPQIFPV